jgi:hypothetical protein
MGRLSLPRTVRSSVKENVAEFRAAEAEREVVVWVEACQTEVAMEARAAAPEIPGGESESRL